MVDEKWQGHLRLVGLIPVAVIAGLAVSLALLGFRGPVFDIADLALVLQFIFVFCVSVLLAVVSARAYLISGSFNILLLGTAPLVSGFLLMVAQWAVTPSLGSTLTPNAAVTIGNLGILIASFLLLIGALLLPKRTEQLWPGTSRKIILSGSFLVAFVLILAAIFISTSGALPVFFTSSGSTVWRLGVLAILGAFLAISCGLFGWAYVRTKSPTLYWYSLGLLSFGVALIGIVYTVRIGESVNWCGRLGLYLSGFFFLMAVLNRNSGQESAAGVSERWASAFRDDRARLASLFYNMTNGVLYGKLVMDDGGNPIDLFYLDMNDAYETVLGAQREKFLGKRATEALPGLIEQVPNWIDPYARAVVKRETVSYERQWPYTGKWYNITVYSPEKGYFVAIYQDITERKDVEKALKESESKYHGLFESILDPVTVRQFVYDEKGEIVDLITVDANKASLKIRGAKSIEELRGKRDSELYGPELVALGLEKSRQVKATGLSIIEEVHYNLNDRDYRVTYVPQGEDHIIFTSVDVTDMKRAKMAAEESRAKLHAALESMTDAIFISDREGNFLEFNDAFWMYHRFRSREECSKSISDCPNHIEARFADGTLAPPNLWAVPRALRGETVTRTEYKLRNKDTGDEWWGSYSFSPIRDDGGDIVGSVVVARDITELKRSEEALRNLSMEQARQQSFLETVLNHSRVGISVLKGEELRYVLVNDSYQAIAPDVPMVGRTYGEIFPEASRSGAEEKIRKVLRTGETWIVERYRAPTPGNPDAVWEGSVVRLPSINGEEWSVLGLTWDVTDENKREDALRESEAKYRGLFENMNELVVLRRFVRDDKGEIIDMVLIDANIAALKARGVDNLDGLKGRKDSELYGRETAALIINQTRKMKAEQRSVTEEQHFDNNDRDYQVTVAPLGSEYSITTSLDITERKKAEEALRESEERLRTMADNISQLAWMADPNGWVFWYNKRWYDYTGTTPEQMKGKGWQFAIDPTVLPKVLDGWKSSIATGHPFDMVFPLLGGDGVFRSFLTRVQPVTDDRGNVVRWFGTSTDISEELEAKRQVEEERARLQAVLEAAPIGVFVGDVHGATVLMNKAFDDIWKGPAPKPSGVSEYDKYKAWFADSGAEIGPEEWPTARGLKGETSTIVADIQRFDGSRGTIMALAAPMRDGSGKVTGVIGIVQDITELRKTEDAFRRSNAELQQFAYVASHDLQEPLRMVTAYLSLIEKKYGNKLDGDAKKYMDFAIEGGLRARDLVRDLLEVSRLDSQSEPMSTMNMNEVMDNVTSNLAVQISEEHATITYDPLPEIMAVKAQIILLMQNLVSNAIKFHGDRLPKVHIFCENRRDSWLFSVSDNGIGIDPVFKDKIFVIFQRLHSRDEYEGTGIGLAISKKIVERHGGRIWFESRPGGGTTFYFKIPKGG